MIIAKWDMNGIFKADAEVVAAEIRQIGDEVTPQQIVDAARDESTELHKCFEWDDRIAAEKYRVYTARQICCHLVINQEKQTTPAPVRMFYRTDRSGGYKPTELIIKDKTEYGKMLNLALSELDGFRRRYSTISELEAIIKAIDDIKR